MDFHENITSISKNWSSHGDNLILKWMEQISQNLEQRANSTLQSLQQLNKNTKITTTALDNAANSLQQLQYTQFVENRCQDDDDYLEKPVPVEPAIDQPKNRNEFLKKFMQKNVEMLHSCYEKHPLYYDGYNEETANNNYIFQPKNPFEELVLPHMIGSNKWMENNHVGLFEQKNDYPAKQSSECSGSIGDNESYKFNTTQQSESTSNLSILTEKSSSDTPILNTGANFLDNTPTEYNADLRKPPASLYMPESEFEHDLFADAEYPTPTPRVPKTPQSFLSTPENEMHRSHPSHDFNKNAPIISPKVLEKNQLAHNAEQNNSRAEQISYSNEIKRKPVNLFDDEDFNAHMREVAEKVAKRRTPESTNVQQDAREKEATQPQPPPQQSRKMNAPPESKEVKIRSKISENVVNVESRQNPTISKTATIATLPKKQPLNLFESSKDISVETQRTQPLNLFEGSEDISGSIRKEQPLNLFDSLEASPSKGPTIPVAKQRGNKNEFMVKSQKTTRSLFEDDDDDDDFLSMFGTKKLSSTIPKKKTVIFDDDMHEDDNPTPVIPPKKKIMKKSDFIFGSSFSDSEEETFGNKPSKAKNANIDNEVILKEDSFHNELPSFIDDTPKDKLLKKPDLDPITNFGDSNEETIPIEPPLNEKDIEHLESSNEYSHDNKKIDSDSVRQPTPVPIESVSNKELDNSSDKFAHKFVKNDSASGNSHSEKTNNEIKTPVIQRGSKSDLFDENTLFDTFSPRLPDLPEVNTLSVNKISSSDVSPNLLNSEKINEENKSSTTTSTKAPADTVTPAKNSNKAPNPNAIFFDEPPDDDDFFQSLTATNLVNSIFSHDLDGDMYDSAISNTEAARNEVTKTTNPITTDYAGLSLFNEIPPDDDNANDSYTVQSKHANASESLPVLFYDDINEQAAVIEKPQTSDLLNRLLFSAEPPPDADSANAVIKDKVEIIADVVDHSSLSTQNEQIITNRHSSFEEEKLEELSSAIETTKGSEKHERLKSISKLKKPQININVHALLPGIGAKPYARNSLEKETAGPNEDALNTTTGRNESASVSEASLNESHENILSSACKNRVRLPANRRPSTRRGRQESYWKSIEYEKEQFEEQNQEVTEDEHNENRKSEPSVITKSSIIQAPDRKSEPSATTKSGIMQVPELEHHKMTSEAIEKAPTNLFDEQMSSPNLTHLYRNTTPTDSLPTAGYSKRDGNTIQAAAALFSDSDDWNLFDTAKSDPIATKLPKSSPSTKQSTPKSFTTSKVSLFDDQSDSDDDLFKSPRPNITSAERIEKTDVPKKSIYTDLFGSGNTETQHDYIEAPKRLQITHLFSSDDSDNGSGNLVGVSKKTESIKGSTPGVDLFASEDIDRSSEKINIPRKAQSVNLFGSDDDDDDDFLMALKKQKGSTKNASKLSKLKAVDVEDFESEDDDDLFDSKAKKNRVKANATEFPQSSSATVQKTARATQVKNATSLLEDNPLADLLNI